MLLHREQLHTWGFVGPFYTFSVIPTEEEIRCIFDDICLNFIKTYIVGAHKNCLAEAIQTSTHNIGFMKK